MKRRHKLLALFGGVVVPAAALHAEVTVTPSAVLEFDDNLFRAPDDAVIIPAGERSDRIYTAGVAVDAVVRPGNWTLRGGGKLSRRWFDRNGYLDNTDLAGNISVANREGSRIGLSLDAQASRQLSAFSDINSRIRNLQSLALVSGRVTIPITPDFRLVVDPQFVSNQNSNPLLEQNDYRQYGAGVGIGYFSPLGNSVVAQVSRQYTEGLKDRIVGAGAGGAPINSPIDLVSTSFDLKLHYAISTFTAIDGRFSYVERKDHSILGSDYSGPAGNISFTYTPSDFTRLMLSAGRRLESQNYIFIDSVRTDYVTVDAQTRVADRIDLLANGQIYRRRFSFDPLSLITGNQRETLSSISVGARYRAFERVELELRGSLEHRSSDLPDHDYDAKVLTLSARVPLTFFGTTQPTR